MDIVKRDAFLKSNFMKDWIYPFVIAVILYLLVRQFMFFAVKVPTPSMFPTIKEGDRIVVTRIYNYDNIKRGDVIVFENHERDITLIKRVIGLPGERLLLKEDGSVYVNGELMNEPYVKNQINERAYNMGAYNILGIGNMKLGEYVIPENHYFFMGDNRDNSIDARYWENSFISESDIEGKAQVIFFPFNRFGKMK